MGVAFILLSCLVQGTQYVFEEKVMAVDGLPPMWLIGLEVCGVWMDGGGCAFCILERT